MRIVIETVTVRFQHASRHTSGAQLQNKHPSFSGPLVYNISNHYVHAATNQKDYMIHFLLHSLCLPQTHFMHNREAVKLSIKIRMPALIAYHGFWLDKSDIADDSNSDKELLRRNPPENPSSANDSNSSN